MTGNVNDIASGGNREPRAPAAPPARAQARDGDEATPMPAAATTEEDVPAARPRALEAARPVLREGEDYADTATPPASAATGTRMPRARRLMRLVGIGGTVLGAVALALFMARR